MVQNTQTALILLISVTFEAIDKLTKNKDKTRTITSFIHAVTRPRSTHVPAWAMSPPDT